ncbi:hypothetical protein VWY34_14270 [Phaeobacter sp. JH20_02]|uniref:hypothetical protein n=1 Tax=unclassified Phaeobacter TaxID=2621772 RepID=UPI003A8AB5F9
MSRHSFDPKIAGLVGLNAAVIFQNIMFWCERNAVKGRNVRDGNVWTYNSVKEFGDLFPYLTPKQVRLALEKLEEKQLLDSGNFNADARDRTKWYALPKCSDAFAQLVQLHLPKRAETIAPEGEPLPDIKPDIKQTPKPPGGADDLFSAENETDQKAETPKAKNDLADIDSAFDEFWGEIWPSHARKAGKADCLKVYRQACTGKHPKAEKISPRALNEATKAYIASVRDPQFLKGPLPWLRQPGWEPFVRAGGQGFRWEDLSAAQQNALSDGRCPPSLTENGAPDEVAAYWLSKFRKAAG